MLCCQYKTKVRGETEERLEAPTDSQDNPLPDGLNVLWSRWEQIGGRNAWPKDQDLATFVRYGSTA